MSYVRCLSLLAVASALGACGSTSDESSGRVLAYQTDDPCSAHTQEADCLSDGDNGCEWIAVGAACPDGTDCPDGICTQPDPCRAHGDTESCEADPNCGWADVDLCPPPGDDCPGGFCYSIGDGDDCTCVCPAYCPAGEECPPCDCDCEPPGGGGGDDTCTCSCPDCAPGETCPPCDCDCGGGSGCSGGGTCTCTCESCPEGQDCPPCDCECDDVPVTDTCECPPCAPGEACEPCDCSGGEADPCLEHGDEDSCVADTANECSWINIGAPCQEGETCVSGVCQGPFEGGEDGCTCVCPDCGPGETCPPCDCGGTGGTTPPGSAGG